MKKIFYLMIVGILLLGFGCIGAKPKLVTEGVQGKGEIWLTGCYSTVTGYVKNTGSADAEDVSITCTATQGGTITSNSISTGALSKGSQVPFSVDVDTDCFGGEATYSCTASCTNC